MLTTLLAQARSLCWAGDFTCCIAVKCPFRSTPKQENTEKCGCLELTNDYNQFAFYTYGVILNNARSGRACTPLPPFFPTAKQRGVDNTVQ
jgi:hypothetical protein